MAQFVVWNEDTNRIQPYPREDDQPVIGLQQPPWYVLTVAYHPKPENEGKYYTEKQRIDRERFELHFEWEEHDLPEPGPDYQSFYDAILGSSVYQAVVLAEGKTGDQAAAMTVFLGAIQETKNIKENRAAMQGAIWLLLSELQLTTAGLAELQAIMDETRMSPVYTMQPAAQ